MNAYDKDPTAELDYAVDWSEWLEDGETITTSTWTVPSPLTQPKASTVAQGKAIAWIGGGVDGQTYRVTNTIVTSAGRKDDRSITLAVRHL